MPLYRQARALSPFRTHARRRSGSTYSPAAKPLPLHSRTHPWGLGCFIPETYGPGSENPRQLRVFMQHNHPKQRTFSGLPNDELARGVACLPSGPYETGMFHPSPHGWVHSTGYGGGAVSPQANKCSRNAVVRAGYGGRAVSPQANKCSRNAVVRVS